MFKKQLPIIFIGLCMVVAVLVLGWNVFVKREVAVPVQVPVVSDEVVENEVVDDIAPDEVEDDISDDVSEVDDLDGKIYKMVDISNKFLFVENSSVYPMNAPYGSLPDTIYVLDSLESNKPVTSFETSILPTERSSYKLFGDKIYFFSRKDKMTKWMNFEGDIHELAFTKVGNWTFSDSFVISPNNQKIAWPETTFENNAINNTSKLIVADLDGKNKKVLLEKNFKIENSEQSKYLQLIKWSNSNKEIYFTEQHGGLGGYIIFDGPSNLSKINITTNKIEYLFDSKKNVGDRGYIGDISSNEEFISYFTGRGDNSKVVIKNLKTEKENTFNISDDEYFKGGGNAYFSHDNKHLVYNIAHWNPDNEYYRTIVVNLAKKEQKTIVDDPQKEYEVIGWASNDKILLRDFDGNTYIINIDGSDFKKIEIAE